MQRRSSSFCSWRILGNGEERGSRQTGKDRQRERDTDKVIYRQRERDTDREKDRQRDIQTERRSEGKRQNEKV